MTSLYNIPSRYLGSYIIKYSIVSEITITHLQIILHAVVISILVLQPCPYLFHHFPELHQKSEHFWTFLSSSPSSNPFEFQISLNLIFQSWPFYFSRNKLIFASPEKLSPCPTLSLTFLFFPFSFSLFFLFCKEI